MSLFPKVPFTTSRSEQAEELLNMCASQAAVSCQELLRLGVSSNGT